MVKSGDYFYMRGKSIGYIDHDVTRISINDWEIDMLVYTLTIIVYYYSL